MLYGRLWDHRDDYAIATAGTNALTGSPIGGTQIIQSAVIDGNTLRAASYTGVDQRSEHHIVQNHTNFYQGVANASWQATDRLKFTALGGYEQSDFSQPVFDKVFMEAKNMAFSFDTRPTIPVNTYGVDLTNPNLGRCSGSTRRKMRSPTNMPMASSTRPTSWPTARPSRLAARTSISPTAVINITTRSSTTFPPTSSFPTIKTVIGKDSLIPYIVGDVDGVYSLSAIRGI
jgi:iron complex outermembrane receptor protein